MDADGCCRVRRCAVDDDGPGCISLARFRLAMHSKHATCEDWGSFVP